MNLRKLIVAVFTLCLINGHAQKSKVWENFKVAKESGEEPILPDFSYAGYKYSEVEIPTVNYKFFDVTSYGAVPNDLNSDKKAIIKAINAAEKYGEGIIYFPKGKYYINTQNDDISLIEIKSSKIVFRGEDEESTILFFDKDLPPTDPNKLWSCPSAIKVKSKKNDAFITAITADAKRETNSIQVADASKIKQGDWVILKMKNNDKELISQDIGPLKPHKTWKKILNEGVQVNERHQVAGVVGNSVTLVSPIHYNIQKKYNWSVYSFENVNHVGFENITFEGNWTEKFVHHKSAKHDGGWSILSLSDAVDSWVRNCTFINVNNAASISSSAACTVINVKIKGNIGHAAVHAANGSTGILLAKIDDLCGMHHSVGVGGGSTTGTVIWRCKYPSHTSFESHASQPRCTLLDNVEGGFFAGRAGGAIGSLPNHGRHLVLWNFKETDDAEKDFVFVATDSPYWRVVPPIIVGFHGTGTTFKMDEVQLLESLGNPVNPASLFEAQLKLRLGKLPKWINEQIKNH